MKRYISAAAKGYDEQSLTDSIYYLFDTAARTAGVSAEDVEITKIKVERHTKPVQYTVCVDYLYRGMSDYILLFRVPINQAIPKGYWVDTENSRYLNKLVRCFDVSKFDKIKSQFEDFCATVKSIGSKNGINYQCTLYPELDRLDPSATFITFYADIVDMKFDDPNIQFVLPNNHDGYYYGTLTDTTTGNEIEVWCHPLEVTYHIDTYTLSADIYGRGSSDMNVIVSTKIDEFMSGIRDDVHALQTASSYLQQLSDIASSLESIPGVTVKYSEQLYRNPKGVFEVQYQGTELGRPIEIDDVFNVDERQLIRNLKAKIRRYTSSRSTDTGNDTRSRYSNRSAILYPTEE